MLKLTVVALLCAQTLARPSKEDDKINPYITGGTSARDGEFPFMVSLRFGGPGLYCGGVLISNKYVLTTAACVSYQEILKVGVGSVNLAQQQLFDVSKTIVHPNFDKQRVLNDIALIKLNNPVSFGPNVQPIDYSSQCDGSGQGVGVGWGFENGGSGPSPNLKYFYGPIINNRECGQRISFEVTSSQICMGGESGKGMCLADYGGPLLKKSGGGYCLSGLFSIGQSCGRGIPDVYTRVSSFTQWIRNNAV